jgi:hypothetical protein
MPVPLVGFTSERLRGPGVLGLTPASTRPTASRSVSASESPVAEPAPFGMQAMGLYSVALVVVPEPSTALLLRASRRARAAAKTRVTVPPACRRANGEAPGISMIPGAFQVAGGRYTPGEERRADCPVRLAA